MLAIYIVIAIGAVILVSVFVDDLPDDLYTKSDNIKGEIKQLIMATGAAPDKQTPSMRQTNVDSTSLDRKR